MQLIFNIFWTTRRSQNKRGCSPTTHCIACAPFPFIRRTRSSLFRATILLCALALDGVDRIWSVWKSEAAFTGRSCQALEYFGHHPGSAPASSVLAVLADCPSHPSSPAVLPRLSSDGFQMFSDHSIHSYPPGQPLLRRSSTLSKPIDLRSMCAPAHGDWQAFPAGHERFFAKDNVWASLDSWKPKRLSHVKVLNIIPLTFFALSMSFCRRLKNYNELYIIII